MTDSIFKRTPLRVAFAAAAATAAVALTADPASQISRITVLAGSFVTCAAIFATMIDTMINDPIPNFFKNHQKKPSSQPHAGVR